MTAFAPDDALDRLIHRVIGAAIEVHRLIGPGYLEAVYEEALCIELELRGIPFQRQHVIHVPYKGRLVGEGRIDVLVDACLVVELKAVETLMPVHTAQVISYLKALSFPIGLLVNFNVPILKNGIKRVIFT